MSSAEAHTTGLMILSESNSPPAEVSIVVYRKKKDIHVTPAVKSTSMTASFH